jgi:large subunit ribosomal protein L21
VVTPARRGTQGKRKKESSRVYAIVRCGGRQEKVALDDVVTVDKLPGERPGQASRCRPCWWSTVTGSSATPPRSAATRSRRTSSVTLAGPKINMIHYRNKTGYRRRLGHRQRYTQVRITGIGTEGSGTKGKAPGQAEGSTAKAQAQEED